MTEFITVCFPFGSNDLTIHVPNACIRGTEIPLNQPLSYSIRSPAPPVSKTPTASSDTSTEEGTKKKGYEQSGIRTNLILLMK